MASRIVKAFIVSVLGISAPFSESQAWGPSGTPQPNIFGGTTTTTEGPGGVTRSVTRPNIFGGTTTTTEGPGGPTRSVTHPNIFGGTTTTTEGPGGATRSVTHPGVGGWHNTTNPYGQDIITQEQNRRFVPPAYNSQRNFAPQTLPPSDPAAVKGNTCHFNPALVLKGLDGRQEEFSEIPYKSRDDVRLLQKLLNVGVDGICGKNTASAVRQAFEVGRLGIGKTAFGKVDVVYVAQERGSTVCDAMQDGSVDYVDILMVPRHVCFLPRRPFDDIPNLIPSRPVP